MEIFQNILIICALTAWFSAQIIKIVISLIRHQGVNLAMLFASGGMPSSHSATVCAVTGATAVRYGLTSPLFAIAAIFSFIVMYDACGVRRAAGEQAKILNKIIRDLSHRNTSEFGADLKELIGHTPFQVIMGAVTGAVVAVVLGFLMNII
jgi:acid phosphatase family membrane protein YuiD